MDGFSFVRYVPDDTQLLLREVPDEISLGISISQCPYRCKGCHSEYLQGDVGEVLTEEVLSATIKRHSGITCVCFLGGDGNRDAMCRMFAFVKENFKLKVAWYSGDSSVHDETLAFIDYIKVGPYVEALGPIDNPATNQKFFRVIHSEDGVSLSDETFRFWKNDLLR